MTRFLNFKIASNSPAPGPFDLFYKLYTDVSGYAVTQGTYQNLSGITRTNLVAGVDGIVSGDNGEYLESIIMKNTYTDCQNTIEYPVPFLVFKVSSEGGIYANPPNSIANYYFYLSGNGTPIATLGAWDGSAKRIIGMMGFIYNNSPNWPADSETPTNAAYFSAAYTNHTGNAAGYNTNNFYYTCDNPALSGFKITAYKAKIVDVGAAKNVVFEETIVNRASAAGYTGINTPLNFNFV
jgi:hypothetical protein